TNEIDDIFSKPKASIPQNRTDKTGAKGPSPTGPVNGKSTRSITSSNPKKPSTASSTSSNTTKAVEVVVANQMIQQDANVAKELQRKHGEPNKKRKVKGQNKDDHPDDDGFFDSRGTKSKRLTEDGLPLFTVQDLRIGEGGDTPDCPFDCQCCF
ncbi:hypothetical protein IWQ61_010319, partial [Dispira simplex]